MYQLVYLIKEMDFNFRCISSMYTFYIYSSCKTAIEELDNQIKVSIKIEELEEKNEELAKNQKGNIFLT